MKTQEEYRWNKIRLTWNYLLLQFSNVCILDFNYEIASKINEEVRSALDPKELECFARQIAAGMVNIPLKLLQ